MEKVWEGSVGQGTGRGTALHTGPKWETKVYKTEQVTLVVTALLLLRKKLIY